MANRSRLNEKSVCEAKPEKGRGDQVFDTEVRQVAARISWSGNQTFTIGDRNAGRQRWMTIGRKQEHATTVSG